MPRTHTRRRCALVAAVLAAAAAAPDAQQQASLAELRASSAPAMLRATVVFAGHPRTFLTTWDGPKQCHCRRRRPLRNNQMRRLRRSRKNGREPLPERGAARGSMCRGRGRSVPQPAERGRGPNRRCGGPAPGWRRDNCEEEDRRPDLNYGRELAHARAAWALVREAEDGFLYDVVVRAALRRRVGAGRRRASWTSSCRRRMISFQT